MLPTDTPNSTIRTTTPEPNKSHQKKESRSRFRQSSGRPQRHGEPVSDGSRRRAHLHRRIGLRRPAKSDLRRCGLLRQQGVTSPYPDRGRTLRVGRPEPSRPACARARPRFRPRRPNRAKQQAEISRTGVGGDRQSKNPGARESHGRVAEHRRVPATVPRMDLSGQPDRPSGASADPSGRVRLAPAHRRPWLYGITWPTK